MTRTEYCGTCHKYREENFLAHTGHRPEKTECTDCDVPAMAKQGKTYSVHDHKFDFSQPEPACTECHEPGSVQDDVCFYKTPDFHLSRVQYPAEMTIEETCIHCHNKNRETRDQAWARAVTPELVNRFIVE